MKTPAQMINPKFYIARRCTRWDVYPQRQPVEIVAHDCQGFWAKNAEGQWFKTPTAYVFQREITEQDAETRTLKVCHRHACQGEADGEGRVYSGVVGPFCSTACRDEWTEGGGADA